MTFTHTRYSAVLLVAALAATLLSPCARAADAAAGGAISYDQVHAVFAKHCLSCHDAKEAEGEFVLESFDTLMRGGEEGPAVVPGKAGESLLVAMIEHKKKPFMPPPKKGPKLSDPEIALIRAWVDAGAKGGPAGGSAPSQPVALPKVAPKGDPRQPVNALAYAAGPKLLAVGRFGVVELRSAENRSLVRRLEGHRGNVNDLVFSADGSILAAAAGLPGVGGEVRIWKVADGTLVRTIEGHADAVYCAAIAPDGKTLATGSYDQTITLWGLDTGAELRKVKGHNGGVFDLAFRNDGKVLASASVDRTVKLWDVATGGRLDTFEESTKELFAVAFSPDGTRVAAGGADNRIRVWGVSPDAKEGTNRLLYAQFAHEGTILRLAWSGDGKTILSSADNNTVKVWNAADVSLKLALPPQPDWPTALASASEGKVAVVGRLDGSLAFYDAAAGTEIPAPPPAKPELNMIEPRGIQRGATTKVKLIGKNLADLSAATASNPMVKAEVVRDGAGPDAAFVNLTADAQLPPGTYELFVTNGGGESGRVKVYADGLPQVQEQEPNDPAAMRLPQLAGVWGAFGARGDADAFAFEAKAGRTVVLDVAAQRLASKADVVLTVADAAGNVLATVNDTDGHPDPLLAFTAPADGTYTARVTDLQLGSSAEHFYRLSVGEFGVVTGAFPLAVPANAETQVKLIGHNLPPGASVTVKAAGEGETPLPLDPTRFRARGDLKLLVSPAPTVVESEPNDQPAAATEVQVNGAADGRLHPGDGAREDVDHFRFTTKAGQTLIVETIAARRGSPADTRIDVLHADGRPVERVLLRAVRDSAITFRPITADSGGARLDHWEEMELNQYLYMTGEVAKLLLYPRGPDSEFDFYRRSGRRRCYFDTSPTAHAMDEPCYIVEPHPPGTVLPPNGLPTFTLNYANDDDADRQLGSDSRLTFTAPADGTYVVRVTDARAFGGDAFVYRLVVREAKPNFNVVLDAGKNPSIPKGAGRTFVVRADRVDGFDGPIRVDLSGVPPGFAVSTPLVIEAGHDDARGTVFAAVDAPAPPPDAADTLRVTATATVNGREITKEIAGFPGLAAGPEPQLFVDLGPAKPQSPAKYTLDQPVPEITIAPGQMVSAWLRVERNGHDGSVSFDVENLPHGVIVADIGLNGVLIPENQTERQVFLQCAPWVADTDRLCYAKAREADNPTSRPVLLRVRKPQQQAGTP